METPGSLEVELKDLRVAIVHYWFVGRAGGERAVEAFAEVFPQADLFALVADRTTLAPVLQSRKLTTSFLQRVPGARKFHRHFLFCSRSLSSSSTCEITTLSSAQTPDRQRA